MRSRPHARVEREGGRQPEASHAQAERESGRPLGELCARGCSARARRGTAQRRGTRTRRERARAATIRHTNCHRRPPVSSYSRRNEPPWRGCAPHESHEPHLRWAFGIVSFSLLAVAACGSSPTGEVGALSEGLRHPAVGVAAVAEGMAGGVGSGIEAGPPVTNLTDNTWKWVDVPTANQDRSLSHTDRHVTGTERAARLAPQMGLRPPTRPQGEETIPREEIEGSSRGGARTAPRVLLPVVCAISRRLPRPAERHRPRRRHCCLLRRPRRRHCCSRFRGRRRQRHRPCRRQVPCKP
jgi:hypothetical protein